MLQRLLLQLTIAGMYSALLLAAYDYFKVGFQFGVLSFQLAILPLRLFDSRSQCFNLVLPLHQLLQQIFVLVLVLSPVLLVPKMLALLHVELPSHYIYL